MNVIRCVGTRRRHGQLPAVVRILRAPRQPRKWLPMPAASSPWAGTPWQLPSDNPARVAFAELERSRAALDDPHRHVISIAVRHDRARLDQQTFVEGFAQDVAAYILAVRP